MNRLNKYMALTALAVMITMAPFYVFGNTYSFELEQVTLDYDDGTDTMTGSVTISSEEIPEENDEDPENGHDNGNDDNDNGNGENEGNGEDEEPVPSTVTVDLYYSPDDQIRSVPFSIADSETMTIPDVTDPDDLLEVDFSFGGPFDPGAYRVRATLEDGSFLESGETYLRDEDQPVIDLDFSDDTILSTASDNEFAAFLTDGFHVILGNGERYSYSEITGNAYPDIPFFGDYEAFYNDDMQGEVGEHTVDYAFSNDNAVGADNFANPVSRDITILPPSLTVTNVFNTWESAREAGIADLRDRFDNPHGGFTFTRPTDNVQGQNSSVLIFDESTNQNIHTISGSTLDDEETHHTVPNLVPGTYYLIHEVNGLQSDPSDSFTVTDTTLPYFLLGGEIFVSGPNDIEQGRREFLVPSLSTQFNEELSREQMIAGVTARDNLDREIPRGDITIDDSEVDYSRPGRYEISYSVTSSSGNEQTVFRNVFVIPPSPSAVGSNAEIGRVDVRNVLTGYNAHLYLYRQNVTGNDDLLYPFINGSEDSVDTFDNFDIRREDSETTFTFFPAGFDDGGAIRGFLNNRLEPGSYYVKQAIKVEETTVTDGQLENEEVILLSPRSNVVDIMEEGEPFIDLNGEPDYQFVHGTDENTIWMNNRFTDPGATITDYLYGNNVENLITEDGYDISFSLTFRGVTLGANDLNNEFRLPVRELEPGIHELIYNAVLRGNSDAPTVTRTVTVAPHAISDDALQTESSSITVASDGLYDGVTADVTLYNFRGQEISTVTVTPGSDAVFTNVPSGEGYYVTQTVNQVESPPSPSIRVDRHNLEPELHSIRLSNDSLSIRGQIEHGTNRNTITFKLPFDTGAQASGRFTAEADFTGDRLSIQGNSLNEPFESTVVNLIFSNQYTWDIHHNGETERYHVVFEGTDYHVPGDWISDGFISQLTIGRSSQPFTDAIQSVRNNSQSLIVFHENGRIGLRIPEETVRQAPSGHAGSIRAVPQTHSGSSPDWKQSLNELYSLTWNTQGQPFHRPAELQTSGSERKSLIRMTADGSAVTLPSRFIGGGTARSASAVNRFSEVGWISHEHATRPPQVSRLGNTLRISNRVSGTDYYWTTDSRNIDHVKSSYSYGISGYSLLNTDRFEENWKPVPSEGILASADETLYLVAYREGLYSTVTAVTPEPAPFSEVSAPVAPDKIWSIDFTHPISNHTRNDQFIYVEHPATGERTDVHVTEHPHQPNTIQVIPVNRYQRGETYRLVIEESVAQKQSGLMTGQTLYLDFTIQP